MRTTESANIEERVTAVLDGLGVPYELLPCDPGFADTAAFCEKYSYAVEECGNTIFVASRTEPRQYAACVVQGSERLDVNKKVRRLMGVSRASFASAEQTMELTGMMICGVTAFALPEGVALYVDRKLMDLDFTIMGSGSRSSKIRVSPDVFRKMPDAEIIDGLSV